MYRIGYFEVYFQQSMLASCVGGSRKWPEKKASIPCILCSSSIVECIWVGCFTLHVGDINSTSQNKFIEGTHFFWQAIKTLGRAL